MCGKLKRTRCDQLGSGKCGSCAGKTRKKSDPSIQKKKRINKRKYIETTCSDCGNVKMRRYDAVWNGRCPSCASREVASRPEMKEVQRQNGKRNPPPRDKVKNIRKGPDHHFWQGGKTSESMKIRLSFQTRQWRKAVFERDNYTCQMCKCKRGGDLEADHIKPFSLFPDLRHDVNNGRTLCKPCHRKYGARVHAGKITREAVMQMPEDGSAWKIG